ncbi:hypothetical protein [Sanguibacter sp. Z1732]
MDDVALCTAFGDVLTILENANVGLDEDRMEAQEQQGWYRLATRVLDRLPSDGDSDVSRAIADLQVIVPVVPAGAGLEVDGVRSPDWNEAKGALDTACDDVDAPLAINMFTGG